MAIGALFGSRDGRTLRGQPCKADLTRGRNTLNKISRGIKDEIIKKSKFCIYGCKDESGVEISVTRENPAPSARSKFQREEPERIGEG